MSLQLEKMDISALCLNKQPFKEHCCESDIVLIISSALWIIQNYVLYVSLIVQKILELERVWKETREKLQKSRFFPKYFELFYFVK